MMDCVGAGGCMAHSAEECAKTDCNADGPLAFPKEEPDDAEEG